MTNAADFLGCDATGGRIRGGPFGDGLWHDVSQAYGWVNFDHSVGPNGYAFHTGLDIETPSGVPLVAMTNGKVIFVGWAPGSEGNFIVLEQGDVEVQYYHMRDVPLVKAGDLVTAGQVVGYVGTTGNSTGPHLHLGVYKPIRSGQTIDPALWLWDLNDYGYRPTSAPVVTAPAPTQGAPMADIRSVNVGDERIDLEEEERQDFFAYVTRHKLRRQMHLRMGGDGDLNRGRWDPARELA